MNRRINATNFVIYDQYLGIDIKGKICLTPNMQEREFTL